MDTEIRRLHMNDIYRIFHHMKHDMNVKSKQELWGDAILSGP